MKKILIISTAVIFLASCTKDITSLNENTKSASVVPSQTLFTKAQLNLANTIASPSVNLNIFRLLSQQWTETTYTDEANYDLVTRNIPQGWWNTFYRDILKNFDETKSLAANDVNDATTLKNDVAIADIMQVFTYYHLVTTFGNIPYTDALNAAIVQPKYDDAATVYSALLTRLDADITKLNTSGSSYDGADIIYHGDVTMWKKFANTLKLKMGILISDSDPVKAKTVVEAAASGSFMSASDNASFVFLASPPNTNPVWVNLIQSGRKDFVAANTIVNQMTALNDPRIPLYFTADGAGGFSGGTYGANSNYATFSKPSNALTAPDFPVLFLDYSETEFIKAEATERGFNVGGTAATHYNNAITASIQYWGGSVTDAATYLAQPSVNYLTATGNYKQKIGIQEWLALYNRGYDAWTAWRRLDYPKLVAPASALSDIPVRYTYPVGEQNLNQTNYTTAATAIGGDKVTTKLFFDKF